MATTGLTPPSTGSPQRLTISSDQFHSDNTTANIKAGENIKALFQMEIKATEAISIARLFKKMTDLRIGTTDLEKTARKMSK